MQAENDARRAKAAADQAAAAAAEASRSLKLGEKQNAGKGKDGDVRATRGVPHVCVGGGGERTEGRKPRKVRAAWGRMEGQLRGGSGGGGLEDNQEIK